MSNDMSSIINNVKKDLENRFEELFRTSSAITITYFDYIISYEIVESLEKYNLERHDNITAFTKIKELLLLSAKDRKLVI